MCPRSCAPAHGTPRVDHVAQTCSVPTDVPSGEAVPTTVFPTTCWTSGPHVNHAVTAPVPGETWPFFCGLIFEIARNPPSRRSDVLSVVFTDVCFFLLKRLVPILRHFLWPHFFFFSVLKRRDSLHINKINASLAWLVPLSFHYGRVLYASIKFSRRAAC